MKLLDILNLSIRYDKMKRNFNSDSKTAKTIQHFCYILLIAMTLVSEVISILFFKNLSNDLSIFVYGFFGAIFGLLTIILFLNTLLDYIFYIKISSKPEVKTRLAKVLFILAVIELLILIVGLIIIPILIL